MASHFLFHQARARISRPRWHGRSRANGKDQGSALVLALGMVVLITLLAIGLFTATRMEVTASRLHYEGVRADMLAREAEDVAVARLKAGTSGTRVWVSQPGRLVTSSTNNPLALDTVVDLHSGAATPAATVDEAVDLNPAMLQHPTRNLLIPAAMFSTNAAMNVKWIYVRKNGTYESGSTAPVVNTTNPITGRMAFWTDDESTKINANTAWTRDAGNTNALCHPSRVELKEIFGETSCSALQQFRTDKHFFNSPLDIRQAGTDIATTAEQNVDSLTHYSHSPDLNMFGEKRIMLTTQKSLAGNAEYFDILKSDNLDPGNVDNIDFVKVDNLLKKIVLRMDRNNWPVCPGVTFTSKYSASSSAASLEWAWQIAANILEYVRSKESSQEIVDPIRHKQATAVRLNSTTSGNRIANTSGDYYLGTTRAPQITEIGIWISRTYYTSVQPYPGQYGVRYIVEVHLPAGAGSIDLANCQFTVQMANALMSPLPTGAAFPNVINSVPIKGGPAPGTPDDTGAYLDSSDTVLKEGTYRKITVYQQALSVAAASGFKKAQRPARMALRVLIGQSGHPMAAVAPMYLNGTGLAFISYDVDPVPFPMLELPPEFISTVSTIDPFTGKHYQDWTQRSNTYGSVNATPVKAYPGPQQDTDSGGTVVTTPTAKMPPKKGSPGNLLGRVESVAELGWVHTGTCCYTEPSVPWRTLRLQPQKETSTTFPDWALLDLFCAPIVPATPSETAIVRPLDGSRGGLLNLNSILAPFSDGTSSPIRSIPLNALLANVTKEGASVPLTSAQTDEIAANIRTRTLANALGNKGKTYGVTTTSDVLLTPAQIVEFAGVADSGEASEAVLRQTLDLSSVRSGVFSIYSIGQSIQQDAQGTIRVLAESRKQRIVELVQNGGVTRVQSVLVRKLSP
ncbi:MAG TPA: hypothetical protein VK970_09355 [Candidatus Methylacidiphilales bacterium]|nr:hypothetical protein [Candidatus Methylacidiphilales bacterium]